MATSLRTSSSRPFGTLILCVVALALYALMLANMSPSPAGVGDAVVGQAFFVLYLTAALWIVLALLMVGGAVMGQMPGAIAVVAIFMLPLSAVGCFVAMDLVRKFPAMIVVPVLLPLLIAFYALWARFRRLRHAFSATATALWVWGTVMVLSAASLVAAYYYA